MTQSAHYYIKLHFSGGWAFTTGLLTGVLHTANDWTVTGVVSLPVHC